MRILLNLLPEEKRELLSSRFYSRFFLWQTSLILLLVIFYAGILGGMYFLLHYQKNAGGADLSSFDQYSVEAKKLAQYQDEFKRINGLTKEVSSYLEHHLEWGKLFVLLDQITPVDVSFFELTTKDYTVSLVGQAVTREAFLAFEAALKASACTSDVKVPISNLFAQTEVDFQVDFNIRRECLLNQKEK